MCHCDKLKLKTLKKLLQKNVFGDIVYDSRLTMLYYLEIVYNCISGLNDS